MKFSFKQIKREIRKIPIGKTILEKAYRVRRKVSADVQFTVDRLIAPDDDMLCLALVMGTQNMALERGTYVEFAPTSGMIDVCKLFGNSIPTFEYIVFHKKIRTQIFMD